MSGEPKKKALQLRTIYLIVYLAIIMLAAVVLLPVYWYLWLLIVAIALVRIAFYYVPAKRYRCNRCGTEFTPGRSPSLRPSPSEVYQDKSKMICPKCRSTDVVRITKGSK